MMDSIDLKHTIVSYKEPVVYLKFKDGAELDVPEIRELISAAEKLAGNKPYLLFSDVRVHLSITPEGRKTAADKKETPLLRANAVLVNSLSIKLIANFFNRFNKPHFRFRVFTDESKAEGWLRKQKI